MQRVAILIGLTSLVVLSGATCTAPLLDLTDDDPAVSPTQLAISLSAPDANRSVPQGTAVTISWTVVNRLEEDAVLTILVESRLDFSQTILVGGRRLSGLSNNENFIWDTSGFASGEYSVRARVEAGGLLREATAAGRITIDEAPTFELTAPTGPVVLVFDLDPNEVVGPGAESDVSSVLIRWRARDAEGNAEVDIALDPDLDHDSGNEIVLATRGLPEEEGFSTIEFDGDDAAGDEVDSGVYNLFARVRDELFDDLVVEAPGTVTVSERPEPLETAISSPTDDTEFLTTDTPTLEIEYTIDEPNDVLIDLKVDRDDNTANGNEITILSQRLVEEDVDSGLFAWSGVDSGGAAVAEGIYNVLLIINRDSGAPSTISGDGLVFFRRSADLPLISLLAPAANATLEAGQFLTINWRDETPGGEARVRLTLDDDATPAEPVETDAAELEILAGREASPDGVQDTFNYQLPASLEPGTYFVFAYIDVDGAAPADNVSTAAGRLIVPDPAAP